MHDSFMPYPVSILYPNFVPQQHFRAGTRLPATVASGREHETTRRVDIDGGYHATAVAGNDRERNCTVSGFGIGLGCLEVVDAEDIMRSAGRSIRCCNSSRIVGLTRRDAVHSACS